MSRGASREETSRSSVTYSSVTLISTFTIFEVYNSERWYCQNIEIILKTSVSGGLILKEKQKKTFRFKDPLNLTHEFFCGNLKKILIFFIKYFIKKLMCQILVNLFFLWTEALRSERFKYWSLKIYKYVIY